MTLLYKNVIITQQNPQTRQPFMIYNNPFSLSGMVDIMRFNIPYVLIAKRKGYIPVIDITDNITYSNGQGENVWDYYFDTVDQYSVDQAYASNNYVIYSKSGYGALMQQKWECEQYGVNYNLYEEIGNLRWKQEIVNYCESEVPLEFRQNKKILGVISRGTDFNRSAVIARDGRPPAGNWNAGVEQLIEATKIWIETEHYDYIYLATEDYHNYSEYVKAFGDKVIATKQERIDLVTNSQYENEPYLARIPKVKSGFEYGLDYLVVLTCLAKCDALMASSGCGAFIAAVGLNKSQYRNVTIVS